MVNLAPDVGVFAIDLACFAIASIHNSAYNRRAYFISIRSKLDLIRTSCRYHFANCQHEY